MIHSLANSSFVSNVISITMSVLILYVMAGIVSDLRKLRKQYKTESEIGKRLILVVCSVAIPLLLAALALVFGLIFYSYPF